MATECKILDKMRNIEIVDGGNFTLSLSPRGPLPITFLPCFGYVRYPISICCMISLIRLTFFNCYSQASILEKNFTSVLLITFEFLQQIQIIIVLHMKIYREWETYFLFSSLEFVTIFLNCSGTNTHCFFTRKKPVWSLSNANGVCTCTYVCLCMYRKQRHQSYLQQRALKMWFVKAAFSPEKQ